MNAKKISILFPIILLSTSALVPALSLFVATPGAAGLQFVPLVQVSPDDNSSQTAGPKACTTPAPVRTSTFFHCYTPTDITKAYGIKALHDAGVDGSGQTIVIVDAYGSPTALHDLQFFSTTFGLPAPDLTIVNPTGRPHSTMRCMGFSWVGPWRRASTSNGHTP